MCEKQVIIISQILPSEGLAMSRTVNLRHIEALIPLLNRSPYFQLLSMRMCALGKGFCRLEVDLERKHFNPFGSVHGGLCASLIDTAAYWAVYCDLPEEIGITSLDVTVDFVAPAQKGRLVVEGKSIRCGKTVCLALASVNDQDGKLIARGNSKMIVLAGRSISADVVSFLESDPLPPKFLS